MPLGIFLPQGPYRPAEVVTIHGEVGDRFMDVPVFGETITLAGLTCIAMPIRPIVSFDERRIDLRTDRRGIQGGLDTFLGAEDGAEFNIDDSSLLARFVHRGIVEILGREDVRMGGTTRFAGGRRVHFLSIRPMNRPFVRAVFVTGEQYNGLIIGALLECLHHLLDVFRAPFSWYDSQHQSMFRVIGHMIPTIALVGIVRIVGGTMLLLLADKGPFLIELAFSGLRGKKPPTRHAHLWSDCLPACCSGPRSLYSPRSTERWLVPHSPPGYARAPTRFSPRPGGRGTTRCLCAQKSGPCRCDNTADASAFSFHSGHTRSNFRGPAGRSSDSLYFGSRIGKGHPSLSSRRVTSIKSTTYLSLARG